jgi:hypothetical protein
MGAKEATALARRYSGVQAALWTITEGLQA